jgi:hypothetical protein
MSLEDRERLKQEVVQAAIIHYQLQEEKGRAYPVVQALELEPTERADYTHKFAVLVAGRPAIVWRDRQGAYKVEDDPDRHLWENEDEEREAYQVLLTAAQYLEVDIARLTSIEVQELTDLIIDGAPFSAAWLVKLNGGESCIVDRYDEETGPRYAIHVSPK